MPISRSRAWITRVSREGDKCGYAAARVKFSSAARQMKARNAKSSVFIRLPPTVFAMILLKMQYQAVLCNSVETRRLLQ